METQSKRKIKFVTKRDQIKNLDPSQPAIVILSREDLEAALKEIEEIKKKDCRILPKNFNPYVDEVPEWW